MQKNNQLKVIKKAVTKVQAQNIGNRMGIDWKKVNLDQFTKGINVEREHGSLISPETNITKDDALKTGRIAWAHLKEIKDYYTRLHKMEEEGEKKQDNEVKENIK